MDENEESTLWSTPCALESTPQGTFWEYPNALRKHSSQHFQRFPMKHFCKWRAGSQSVSHLEVAPSSSVVFLSRASSFCRQSQPRLLSLSFCAVVRDALWQSCWGAAAAAAAAGAAAAVAAALVVVVTEAAVAVQPQQSYDMHDLGCALVG